MKLNLHQMKLNVHQMELNLNQIKLNMHQMKFNLHQMKLNLHQMKFNFHQIFYRLIGATLIGNFFFFMIPSKNEIEISVKVDTCVLLGVKGLIQFRNFHFLQPFMDQNRFFVVFRDII